MLSAPDELQFLSNLVKLIKAKKTIDIGEKTNRVLQKMKINIATIKRVCIGIKSSTTSIVNKDICENRSWVYKLTFCTPHYSFQCRVLFPLPLSSISSLLLQEYTQGTVLCPLLWLCLMMEK